MAEHVILHIGTPKTGTTYLQASLWTNRVLLAAAGVHLPLSRRHDHRDAAKSLSHREQWADSGSSITWDDLAADIARTPGTAVVSEESLASLDPDSRRLVLESLAPAELHIVVTGRDPIRQIPSVWQQSLRHARTFTLDQYTDRVVAGRHRMWNLQQDLPDLLGRWTELVPAERIHLVTVPAPGTAPGALWGRFCAVLGVDPEGHAAPARAANTTLDAVGAEVLRRLNVALDGRLAFPRQYVPVVRRHVLPTLQQTPRGTPIRFPERHLGWAADYTAATIDAVGRLGIEVVGDLADLSGRREPPGAAPALSEERINELTVGCLADLAVAEAELQARLSRIRAREAAARPSPWRRALHAGRALRPSR